MYPTGHPLKRIFVRLALWGLVICMMLALFILGYGQPSLLLEQINLRYCG